MEREIIATTPQGLVVSVEPDGSWGALQLAQNTLVDPTSGATLSFLMGFTDLRPRLRSAFQTNNPFLVVTDNANLGSFENTMGVGTKSQYWEFAVDTGSRRGDADNDYRNVLIFKFCYGTVAELVQNPMRWTQPGDFNSGDLATVSRWLQEYVADGIQQSTTHKNHFFEAFAEKVVNPNWNGILALKVDIKKVPGGLAGLLGGGSNRDDPVPPAPDATYEFKVLTLQVRFENTRIVVFSNKAQVTTKKLFGDPVTGIDDVLTNLNTLVFTGLYRNSNGEDSYVFEWTASNTFAFNEIEINKASFNTLPEDGATMTLKRFRLWGYVDPPVRSRAHGVPPWASTTSS